MGWLLGSRGDEPTPAEAVNPSPTTATAPFAPSPTPTPEPRLAIFNDRINENLTLEELASRHEVSRGTADNELRRIGAIIREHVVDDDNFNLIVEKVIDLAFHKGGERDG